MRSKQFFALLKENKANGLFLLHGEEEYLKRRLYSAAIESVPEAVRDLNVQLFDRPQAYQVEEAVQTLPFLHDIRVVGCMDMQQTELKAFLKGGIDVPDNVLLLVYMYGDCPEALLKSIRAEHKDIAFAPLTGPEAAQYVSMVVEKRGGSISHKTVSLLVELVGTDMRNLINEIDKALNYAGGGEITATIVKNTVSPSEEYERYGMLDKFLFGESGEAMVAMLSLLNSGTESAFGLAHFFTGQCKNMLLARLLLDKGVKERDVASKLNLYYKQARSAVAGAKRLNAETLREAVNSFAYIDYLQVTGQMPADRALTLAVIKYFA